MNAIYAMPDFIQITMYMGIVNVWSVNLGNTLTMMVGVLIVIVVRQGNTQITMLQLDARNVRLLPTKRNGASLLVMPVAMEL